MELLRDDRLRVPKEELVFSVVQKWFLADPEKRNTDFVKVGCILQSFFFNTG